MAISPKRYKCIRYDSFKLASAGVSLSSFYRIYQDSLDSELFVLLSPKMSAKINSVVLLRVGGDRVQECFQHLSD